MRDALLTLGLALLAASPVMAQQMSLAPSPALACLTPASEQRGKPEYPAGRIERKEGGTVKVALTFTGPELAPEVKVLQSVDHRDLVDAVLRHVETYRVPCLDAVGGSATLQFEFRFDPHDGRRVGWLAPVDMADAARARMTRCIAHVKADAKPMYPIALSRRGDQGSVLARLRFTAADQPPEVTVLDPSPHPAFAMEVKDFAAGYRMPCHRGAPVSTDFVFRFVMEGGTRVVLRDLSLVDFLRAARNAMDRPVSFDFDAMVCPFDVRLTYFRPSAPSAVGQVGDQLAARRPLLEWLSGLTLNLPDKTQNLLLGDTLTITVPCGNLKL
jgi:hypothetical protein